MSRVELKHIALRSSRFSGLAPKVHRVLFGLILLPFTLVSWLRSISPRAAVTVKSSEKRVTFEADDSGSVVKITSPVNDASKYPALSRIFDAMFSSSGINFTLDAGAMSKAARQAKTLGADTVALHTDNGNLYLRAKSQTASYNNTITSLNNSILTTPDPDINPEDAALFPTYTETEFCDQNLAFISAHYLYYLTTMGVSDLNSPYYLSIGEFGNTWLNYGYQSGTIDLSDVVDYYDTYESTHTGFGWNEYVNTIYMNDTVCPPNPMATPMPDITLSYPCEQLTQNADAENAAVQYGGYLENTIENFKQRYIEEARFP